jgi:hypothetical protein
MRKSIQATKDITFQSFLSAVLYDAMSSHPEFVQEPGNQHIEELADQVRALGWPVLHRDTPSSTAEKPDRVVRTFYIP